MRSRTKNELTDEQIIQLFSKAKIEGVTKVSPMGAGEFNAVYAVDAGGKSYALKIAPMIDVLPYERNMMSAEVYWYKLIGEKTDIKVPKIYYFDDSCSDISSAYFIMDRIVGEQLDLMQLSNAEKIEAEDAVCQISATLNNVKGEKFGYVQLGLKDNWYDAIRSIVQTFLDSAKEKGHKSKNGEKLLVYIDKYADILKKTDSRLLNIDLWQTNIIAKRIDGKLQFWLIDPERCLWGDRISNFVCLQYMTPNLFKKTKALTAYNRTADEPIIFDAEQNLRYGIMMSYIGLIMEVEKYYRYTPFHFGWWRNVFGSKFLYYKIGFSILKKGV